MPLKIQFRESNDAVAAYIEAEGLNANELARDAFEEKVRARMARSRRERLAVRKIRPPEGAGSKWAREERDE